MGALGAVIVGVALARRARPIVAIPVALAGRDARRRRSWGFIPGFLKAVSGAHEVVTTIMLNYVAVAVLAALVSGPLEVAGLAVADHLRRRQRRLPDHPRPQRPHRDPLSRRSWRSSSGGSCSGRRAASRSGSAGANPDAARYAGMRRAA